jgi:membrane dipeptidase
MTSRLIPLSFLFLLACSTGKPLMNQSDDALHTKANKLAQKFIITDTHVDFPYRLYSEKFKLDDAHADIPISSDKGNFDYDRAKKGGLDAPWMVAYVPSDYQNDLGKAKLFADSIIDMVHWIIDRHPDKFARGDSPSMIEANSKKGLISFPMGMENGAPVKTLEDLAYFYKRGIRYITLTHAKDNHICDSSYDTTRTWNGMSPFGFEMVKEMNKVGMIIDVSHISDSAFYQVLRTTSAPVMATHSSCRKYTPGWERNMSDEMIVALAKNGGVIQINFGSSFLDSDINKLRDSNRVQLKRLLFQLHLKDDDPAAKTITDRFNEDHPEPFSTVQRVADHIDHVKSLVGIDYVGIGSDFDGVGDSLPAGLKDVSMYPNLIAELLKRGYTEEDIEKICYKNTWRVWNKIIQVAAQQ